MIYDCFIFNKELDLLELRLEFLYNHVDRFVIVESRQTLSGLEKPLYFQENEKRFQKYSDKIIHLVCPNKKFVSAWDYEYFQRDYIKNALRACSDDDIVLVSDVDEIINLPDLKKTYVFSTPYLVELSVHYYFLNLRSHHSFRFNLIAPYRTIKSVNLGNRQTYSTITSNLILNTELVTGWHFSYLFGNELPLYINKVQSFSHQEYNSDYYLDEKRIQRCISLGIDLFERTFVQFVETSPEKNFTPELRHAITHLGMDRRYYYVRKPITAILTNKVDFDYTIKYKTIPRLKKSVRIGAGKIKQQLTQLWK